MSLGEISPRGLRRAITIPAYLALTVILLGTLPVLILVSLLVDLAARRPLPLTRTLVFLTWYLLCESMGLLVSLALWLRWRLGRLDRDAYLDWNFRLQSAWARWLLGGAGKIFSFSVQVQDSHLAAQGPLLLLIRHVSVADTVLMANYVSGAHGLRLRYVLKRELLWDPCIDVAGHRLPNVFVDRSSTQSEHEIQLVSTLARNLGTNDGVLIYPEGTRFTPSKQARAFEKLATSSDAWLLERAKSFRHVLPPRLGGPLALLDECEDADVVFCAHTGFEGTMSFKELWHGALIGRHVRVRFWRVPRAQIPVVRRRRIEWLYDQWARVDAWIGDHSAKLG